MSETCPKCGAINLKEPPDKPHYECESWVDYRNRIHESGECKDRQIHQLLKLLEEDIDRLLQSAKGVPCICQFRPLTTDLKHDMGLDGFFHIVHPAPCGKYQLMNQAAALLAKLRAVKEE